MHDLYEAYPDFDIDVRREQELLAAHEVIVLQHPFYWYSAPALLKEWQDLVLEHGWAYGSGGTALRGKALLSAPSRPAGARRPTGRTASTASPVRAAAGADRADRAPVRHGLPAAVRGARHARDWSRRRSSARPPTTGALVEALRDGRLDLAAAARDRRVLNAGLDAVLGG